MDTLHVDDSGKTSLTGPEGREEEKTDGPLRVEDETGRCTFTCRKDGSCRVRYQSYKRPWHGGRGFCYPRSRRNGTCNLPRGAPSLCRDCHAAREKEKGSSCEEPKPEIKCDYICDQEVFCMVNVTKIESFGSSWRTMPHDHEDVPKQCQDKCLEANPGCERPKGVTCEYYCDRGHFCMVKFTRNEGGLISTGTMPDFMKNRIPRECHNKCQREHPNCGWK